MLCVPLSKTAANTIEVFLLGALRQQQKLFSSPFDFPSKWRGENRALGTLPKLRTRTIFSYPAGPPAIVCTL